MRTFKASISTSVAVAQSLHSYGAGVEQEAAAHIKRSQQAVQCCNLTLSGRVNTRPSSRAVATRLSRRQHRPTSLRPQPPNLHVQSNKLHVSALTIQKRATACPSTQHMRTVRAGSASVGVAQSWCRGVSKRLQYTNEKSANSTMVQNDAFRESQHSPQQQSCSHPDALHDVIAEQGRAMPAHNMKHVHASVTLGSGKDALISPFLFGVFVEMLHERIHAQHPTEGPTVDNSNPVHVPLLLFADDVAPLSYSPQGLQRLLHCLADFCDENHLTVSIRKTNKVVVFHKALLQVRQGQQLITVQGKAVAVGWRMNTNILG
jgi:hypothetical protein